MEVNWDKLAERLKGEVKYFIITHKKELEKLSVEAMLQILEAAQAGQEREVMRIYWTSCGNDRLLELLEKSAEEAEKLAIEEYRRRNMAKTAAAAMASLVVQAVAAAVV